MITSLRSRTLALISVLVGFVSLGHVTVAAADPAGEVHFNRDIRPILAEACFHCHGPDPASRKAKMRFDREEDFFTKHEKGLVVVKGKPLESLLYQRITTTDKDDVMPPPDAHVQLKPEQKELLRRWIEQGATWQKHWSFIAPERPLEPKLANAKWVRNPIDKYVLAGLEAAKLQPAPEADRATLARRLSLDLTGLPPTPEQIDAFVADKRPDAYEKLVDQLIASPHYGEHRARYWLDAARYADTNGMHFDNYREIWPYRDWVIDAFNTNQKFDQFTIEQIAGDLLPNPTIKQKIATGFHRCNMTTNEGGTIDEENMVGYARDRVETTSWVWLGLTANCAVCHDHKFDPISQRDFYSMSAYFRNTTEHAKDDNAKDAPPVLRIPGISTINGDTKKKPKKGEAPAKKGEEPSTVAAHIQEEKKGKAMAYILMRGAYDKRGDQVEAGVFQALHPEPANAPKNRLGLAKWLVAPDNGLTPRVTINRLWQEFFGTGIVRSSEDFGIMGEAPSNAALLDWLAVEFRSDWDYQRMIKLIVTSATYRQAAIATPEKIEKDPANRLLSRGPRFRMDAEVIRDYALSVSGLLVPTIGGESVKPYQPPGVWEAVGMRESNTKVYKQDKGSALYRRSMYSFWKRMAPPASMEILNATNRETSCLRRERTNTPLQALVTLNDPQFVEAARALAEQILKLPADKQVAEAGRRTLLRPLTTAELPLVQDSYAKLRTHYGARSDDVKALLAVGEHKVDASLSSADLAAMTMLCNQLLNLDEVLNK